MRIRSVRRARERARVREENGKREKGKVVYVAALLTRCPGTHYEGSRKSAGQPRRRRERGGASCTAWSPMFRVTTIVPNADGRKTPSALALLRKHLSSASHLGGSRLSSDGASKQVTQSDVFAVCVSSHHLKSCPIQFAIGIAGHSSTFRPHPPRPSEAHTCAREQQPNPTSPHRHLFHHTHVTRTWAIASLPLRHRSAGAGACTRTPGRRGRQPWR